ncbi:MAG: hypothetical protein EXR72_01035 [Myxococcales bacterium]|nr:hypothetical protein [Myxococcales bacterium]
MKKILPVLTALFIGCGPADPPFTTSDFATPPKADAGAGDLAKADMTKPGVEEDLTKGGDEDLAKSDEDLAGPGADMTMAPDLVAPPTCMDQLKNQDESDADCGGMICGKCGDGKMCAAASDCKSGVCTGGACQAPACNDGVPNGMELDVDCGGNCPKCTAGQKCGGNGDCDSNVCMNGVCSIAGCMDMVKNGKETDLDCGGGMCPGCDDGKVCVAGSDCKNALCAGGKCVTPTCLDKAKNGVETDVDCGGGGMMNCAKCADGKACAANTDCTSGVCTANVCKAAGCMDMIMNGAETDVDCGAGCPKCVDTKKCKVAGDCASGVCTALVCKAATCADTVKNALETDVDCGGAGMVPCAKCNIGKACAANSDCNTALCTALKCVSSCANMKLDGTETDLDCGGICGGCAATKICKVNGDCLDKNCVALKCAAPTCADKIQNAKETDVDCGGGTCAKCADTKKCGVGGDCQNGACTGGVCQGATCNDMVKNGTETGTDCGSNCPKCPVGQGCNIAADCVSLNCTNQLCTMASCGNMVKDGPETDTDCGGGLPLATPPTSCAGCKLAGKCVKGSDCENGQCTNNLCIGGTCVDKKQSGAETDVDCGGNDWCGRCIHNQKCTLTSDCKTGMACVGAKCLWPSCKALKADNAVLYTTGSYDIAPDGMSKVTVFCDQDIDGGGWTVVSMNGDVTVLVSACKFRLKSDAPACGVLNTPDRTKDWQIAGSDMNKIKFNQILFHAYDVVGTPKADTRFTIAGAAITVGTGLYTGVSAAIGTAVNCDQSTLTNRNKISVDIDGYTIWGETAAANTCAKTGGVSRNLGLNVQSNVVGATMNHWEAGWDSKDDDFGVCSCFGLTTPFLGGSRGYYGVR